MLVLPVDILYTLLIDALVVSTCCTFRINHHSNTCCTSIHIVNVTNSCTNVTNCTFHINNHSNTSCTSRDFVLVTNSCTSFDYSYVSYEQSD